MYVVISRKREKRLTVTYIHFLVYQILHETVKKNYTKAVIHGYPWTLEKKEKTRTVSR